MRAIGLATLPGTLAVALLPSDRFAAWHPYLMVLAGLPGLVAAALAVNGLAREGTRHCVPLVIGGAAMVTSSLDFGLYIRQLANTGPGPAALAILERTAVILVLAWMWATAWRARVDSR